jgi:hypothetical protein
MIDTLVEEHDVAKTFATRAVKASLNRKRGGNKEDLIGWSSPSSF